MVLHPLPSGERERRMGPPIPAWQAVEKRQKQSADKWWLITQPDHAVFAGDLAAQLDFPAIPTLSSEVISAIAVHDAGWGQFDNDAAILALAVPILPRSFLKIAPAQFLIAWTDSINAAERISPAGGIIVSEHFSRLTRSRLGSRTDSEQDVQRLEEFLRHESRRQARLRAHAHESASELESLTDVLQFCDLVSLYLCCGASEPAEFPQRFGASSIRVRCEEDAFLFTPPVFGRGAALGISARRHPGGQPDALPFLLG
ncbi:MAG TPA: DUF3891 family protein [Terriglobales bacterium]|nr:DUF3891 family protein [Terriglobales bacterium]